MDEINLKLKEIMAGNADLQERAASEKWAVSYNKKADMLVMGAVFPEGSYYFPVYDSGVLVRIDNSNRIYGFGIENAERFSKENPEIGVVLSFVMHPVRSLVLSFVGYHTLKGIRGMKKMTGIFTVSNFVASKAVLA